MRRTVIALLAAALVSTPVQAIGDLTALLNVQEDCAQVGDITFGANGRWADCEVTKGRWVSTIDLVDMYQAQYCLGGGQGVCQQRALLLFGNRAYTPIARLLIQHIDPGATEYDDPLVISNEYGKILTISAQLPNGERSSHYYLWHKDAWQPIDAQHWLRDLAKQLPAGVRAGKVSLPDVDTMSAKVTLLRTGSDDCCASAGFAEIELGLKQKRFSLKKIAINKTLDQVRLTR